MRPCPHWGGNVPALVTLHVVSVPHGRTGPCWHSLLHFGDAHNARGSFGSRRTSSSWGRRGDTSCTSSTSGMWPSPRCRAKGRMEVHFSSRVFTGFGFAASVRAEQHNSRLQRDTGPCNSISFDQFFSRVGNTPESVSACFMEGCKGLPWLIHKAQMGSWKTDILLSP